MGHRTEQRIAISLPVTVRGLDPHGHPFETTTETHDISCSGACLNGVGKSVELGSRVEIQCGDQRAWYRVQWADNSPMGLGRAGVRCLEPGNYIWGVPPKEWVPDNYEPSHSEPAIPEPVEVPPAHVGAPAWSGADRRQFPRCSCRIEAQVTTDNGAVRLPGTVTDISLGGCYVEMLVPLPVDTAVEVLLQLDQTTAQMFGRVRSSQTGLGMGIAFTGMRPADFAQLQRLAPAPTRPVAIPKLAGTAVGAQRAAAPMASARAVPAQSRPPGPRSVEVKDVPATPEAFQAVVRLLFRKGLLTREELTEELEKLKPTRT